MKMDKSGGPAYPTLNGAVVDDKTFRFEGMTLFDFYVGQFAAAGCDPADVVPFAVEVMKARNKYLTDDEEKS